MKPLHTKYRPKTFDEMVGNEHVVSCLKEMLERKSRPHVFLLHGEKGTGKTSLAHVIGYELDCQQIEYYNVANERGVDTAREIIESARYRPFKGHNKLYILDEIQNTGQIFQQSLLNVLEETPDHAYFAICTTNPEKIIATIKDRCQAFELRALNSKDCASLITSIAKKEKKSVSEKVIHKIVSLSDGRPRAAIMLLEKFISFGEAGLTSEMMQLEDVVQTQINILCQALMKKAGWSEVKKALKEITAQDTGKDPESIRRMILGYFNAVAMNQDEPNKRLCLLFECFKDNYYNTGKAGLTFSCQYATLQ